jgi:hypothetical protein
MNFGEGAMKKIFWLSFVILFTLGNPAECGEKTTNMAVSIKILGCTSTKQAGGQKASAGHIFILLETEWENIHPKQKVEKDRLEGKTDRTMGVGALSGKKKKADTEVVEVDVAYQVGKLSDHVYLLADGLAFPLHQVTENTAEGVKLQEIFGIPKQGERRKASFVYLIPEGAKNIGFQFFDYEYGHIVLPIKGSLEEAKGKGIPPGNVLDHMHSSLVEMAAHSIDFQKTYDDDTAPEGWAYAVIQLSGKSLSGKTIKDIVQIEPTEYTWINTAGGYMYYALGGSTDEKGMIRFTPEVFQYQEIAFLIPSSARATHMGVRLRNDVFWLKLSDTIPEEMPEAVATHRDGDVMEIKLLGMRKENGRFVVDIGIQSLENSGIEIQRKAQFQLVVDGKNISLDDESTDRLLHRPPNPFVIPPKSSIRFELAFETSALPTSLYYRGYASENVFALLEKDDP